MDRKVVLRSRLCCNDMEQEVPPKVEYSLTDLGRSLKPILDEMSSWGEDYKASLNRYKSVYIQNVFECEIPVHAETFRDPNVMNIDVISGFIQRFMKKKPVFSWI